METYGDFLAWLKSDIRFRLLSPAETLAELNVRATVELAA